MSTNLSFSIDFQFVIKRTIDILVSAILLLLLSPLLLVIAIAVKLDSKGKAIYSHERIGKSGQPFQVYKFRSMVSGGDDKEYLNYLTTLIENERNGNNGTKVYRKMDNDSRVTRVGRFIRKFYLDELPQLWNVLKGDMSLVGPRPHVRLETDHYLPYQRRRLIVTPGMTGLWQVAGKGDCTFNELIELDLLYIDHWSMWLDFRIILRTATIMLLGGDEFWTRMEKKMPASNRRKSSSEFLASPIIIEAGDRINIDALESLLL